MFTINIQEQERNKKVDRITLSKKMYMSFLHIVDYCLILNATHNICIY